MPLPLYKADNHPKNTTSHPSAHGGLWFEKFFQDYEFNYKKTTIKKNVFKAIAKSQGNESKITAYQQRRLQLVTAQKGHNKIFTTHWNFITGMGQNHPVENGFSWHHTLGTPYLTGASVKGLLRHWMRYYKPECYQKIAKQWFGNEPQDNSTQQVGQLIFFDAIPTCPAELTTDIMTPHYGNWYSEGDKGHGKDAPHDAHTPKPITFIAVKKASFLFSIVPCNPNDVHLIKEAKEALEQLTEALKYLGAGAKTAAGYGRMFEDFEATKKHLKYLKQAKEQQLENEKSSLIKEMIALRKALTSVGSAAGSEQAKACYQFLTKHVQEFNQWTAEEKSQVKAFFKEYPVSKKKAKETGYKAIKVAIKALN